MIVYGLDAKIINIYNGIGKDVIIVNNQELNKEFAARRVICNKPLEATEAGVMDISIGGVKYTGLKNSIKIHPFEGYDNYDVINVDRLAEIPKDYFGAMGVPITFIYNYNPEQFEIIKFRKGDDEKDLRYNGKEPYFRVLVKRKK